MTDIHPLAYVDPRAEIGQDVCIAPFAYVGPDVRIGDRCTLHPHATLLGPATIGPDNEFFPHCTIGAAPQDLKYKGGPTDLVIGRDNTFRESVTIHRGTESDEVSCGTTRIADNNLFMVGVHVAHDCEIGNHTILANNVLLAGHVRIENCVIVSGASAMHHFVTVGRNAFVGGMTRITHDVPPYMKVEGRDQEIRAVNATGMARWQIPEDSITSVKSAFRLIYPRSGGRSAARTAEALREIEADGLIRDEHVRYLAEFLRRKLEIGIFGRVREALRTDDRRRVYEAAAKEPTST